MVLVDKKEYEYLLRNARKLQALENGGVDNWEWYGESLREFWEEDENE
jgi:hypothetical protein